MRVGENIFSYKDGGCCTNKPTDKMLPKHFCSGGCAVSRMEDWLLLSDLVLEEPRLQPCAGTAEVRFAGLGSAREGAGSGWLVFAEPSASARHTAHELADAAAIIVLADETVGRAQEDFGGVPVVLGAPGLTRADVRRAVDELWRRTPNHRAWQRMRANERLSTALMAQRPESELLARAVELTGDAYLLLTRDGEVVASVGELPSRTVGPQLVRWPEGEGRLHAGRWTMAARLLVSDETDRASGGGVWLVRGNRSGREPDLDEPACTALCELLVVVAVSKRNLERARLTDSTVLLTGLCDANANKEELEQALVRRGFSEAGLHIFVAGTANDAYRPQIAQEATPVAARAGVPLLIGHVRGRTTVVSTESSALSEIARVLPGPVGISNAFMDVQGGALAWRQAVVAAVATQRRRVVDAHHLFFAQCTATETLAATAGFERLAQAVSALDAAIAGLKEGAAVFTAYEAEGFSVPRAAKALGVHPNTVRNRLEELGAVVRFGEADLSLWALSERLAPRLR